MSRIVDASRSVEDAEEVSLRPQSLKEYVGQKELKSNLEVFIAADKHRKEKLDHILL